MVSKDIFYTEQVELLRQLCSCFTDAAVACEKKSLIDSLSFRLVMNTPVPFRIISLCLCAYKLRYNELASLTIPVLLKPNSVKIWQPKVGTFKVVSNLLFTAGLKIPVKLRGLQLNFCSYGSFKSMLAFAKRAAGFRSRTGCLDDTHIFRHLYASSAYYGNISSDEISKNLGHADSDTYKRYVHDRQFFLT